MSNHAARHRPLRDNWLSILLGTLALGGLYTISRYNFLLFHCLAEAFSIVIATAVFVIFWNTRRILENGVYLVLGFGCLFAGVLDLIYIFTYPGMTVFPEANGNLALQAKTAAQWYVSLSCVGAIPFLRRSINQNLALLAYSVILALAIGSMLCWRVFPDCFVEGVGITQFERIGLAISCSAYLSALVLLILYRGDFDTYVFRYLAATLIAFFVEDAACAVATEMNDLPRTLGHLCQVIALYCVYKAFVDVGLRKPYELLFRSQQQTAEALERQQRFLEAVLDNAQSGIVACDANGVLTLFNRALREFHGLPQEPIPAEQWAEHYDLYHPDGKTPMTLDEVPLFRALRGERLQDVEMTVIPKAGSARAFVTSGTPLRGKDGETRGAVVVMHDITQRKRAEEALSASEERYRLLVETIPQLAWRATPDGLDIDCNRRWFEYTGQTPAQVRANGWLAAVHPDDLFRVMETALRAANNRKPYEVEYRLRRSDGAYRWHLARALPALGEDGQVLCWFGSATDIEDLKQAQEVLKKAHDDQLESHRAELAHVARLSMMGEMAANLAHELNQPLHAINNYASGSLVRLVKTPTRDAEIVAALEQIGKEANRAAEIVRRVRGFVQKRQVKRSEVSLNKLVDQVLLLNKADLEQRHGKVALTLAADLPAVLGDPVQIEQVIMNLVRNGLEAMDDTPEANRLLGVKTMLQGGETVQLEVRDRGKGIARVDLDKVFEPFFTTKPEGMGMGLAISRSIVQAHGGRLWVSANEDQGCTFHFTLPVGNRS